ncbi:hypothetical protein [Marinobacterium sp. xm-a-152]|jgi:hypothetical protein|uniref:hypothetical protein n=1 Tax=Marinobacterium sp. xm-a-152 TaxID=2497733 RepID=UPI001569257C|nr:hypothetical protein [Marinobacterium sp. xm-a-152]NRP15217.1 hypothetical protein [Marinobacterium sp. xm-a-152]
MGSKNSKLEQSIIAGEGSVFVSAKLSEELFSTEDSTTLDVTEFAKQARRMAQQLNLGDSQPLVDKLASQVHLLDVLFTRTMQLAVNQNTPERMLALMDMALKVQNNTRRTASTINELTHPKVANNYIRTDTANVATNQQINYSEKNLENELNTGDIHEMDRQSPSRTGRADQRMETLVEVDRSED